MALLLHHLHGVGDVILGQPGQPQPPGFKVDGEEKAQVVQEGGDDGGQHDVGVAQVEEFRHDEAHRAHDGGAELAPRGGHRFHRPGELLFIAGLLHQGDGNGSGGSYIGDGGPVNHSHQSGGQHRHLGGSSRGLAHQSEGKIVDKFGKPAVFQKGSKDHKEKNVGGRHADARTQQALGAPELGGQHPLEGKAIVAQLSGKELAEPVVGQEDGR